MEPSEYDEKLNRRIVTVKEACIFYLDGKRVRRYITSKMFAEARKKAHEEGRNFNSNHTWKDVWIWLDKDGKRHSNVPEQRLTEKEFMNREEDGTWCFSPLDVVVRRGFNEDQLWEIEL